MSCFHQRKYRYQSSVLFQTGEERCVVAASSFTARDRHRGWTPLASDKPCDGLRGGVAQNTADAERAGRYDMTDLDVCVLKQIA